jgi:hypothetical protein
MNLKKLLVALGLSSALFLAPALAIAQTSDQPAPAAGSDTTDAAKMPMKPMKPMKMKHHKAHKAHMKMKSKPMMEPKPDADPNAPKT